MLPLKQFRCCCPFLILSRKIIKLLLHLSPPSDRWHDVLSFVPAGCVSSSSALPLRHKLVKAALIISLSAKSSPLTLACPEEYIHSVFKCGCQTRSCASVGFTFHFLLFTASSLTLWGWWPTVWPDCHLSRQSSRKLVWLLSFQIQSSSRRLRL